MSDLNGAMATALVSQWAAAGVTHAALAPGSRSTPLALALAAEPRVALEVFLDERSASFFALGAAKASGRPAVVACTSGTAAANFHPAVMEARHAHVPLLVCTADRPPELRDTGAGQTMDQLKLYGDAVRWFADVGLVAEGERYWTSVANRAWAEALGPPGGPVHLNLPFREPLTPAEGEPAPPRQGAAVAMAAAAMAAAVRHPSPHPDDVSRLADAVAAAERGLVVAGWGAGVSPATLQAFAAAAGWPILADGISGLRLGHLAVSTYDTLLRSPAFAASHRPDLVVRVGAAPTGRVLTEWLDPPIHQILVDPDRAWPDPRRVATERLAVDADALLSAVTARLAAGNPRSESAWLQSWRLHEQVARHALNGLLDSWDEPFEGRVARDLVASLRWGTRLVVGSSMPVRDLESFAGPRDGLGMIVSNRGVNGIDGFVSTVLGVAAASDGEPTVALLGDLTLLHDVGGLLWAAGRGLQATFVVLDNDGGGIFSFLPQATAIPPARFDALFGTPHGRDLLEVAAAFGVPGERVRGAPEVVPAVLDAVSQGGVRLVVVPTDRASNVDRHRQAWAVVAEAVAGLG